MDGYCYREDNITNEELYYRRVKSMEKVKYIFIRIIHVYLGMEE